MPIVCTSFRRVLLLLLLLIQVLTLQHQYVRPASDDLSEMRLTDECKTLTGLSEDSVRNAQPLDHVLDDVSMNEFFGKAYACFFLGAVFPFLFNRPIFQNYSRLGYSRLGRSPKVCHKSYQNLTFGIVVTQLYK